MQAKKQKATEAEGGPLPALHKTGSAYRFGVLRSDDPEDEKSQKVLKVGADPLPSP